MTVVNRITVGGTKELIRLTLYNNNTKIGFVTNVDMDFDGYDDDMEVSFQHYQNYLRECLVEMINQGAINDIVYDDSTYDEEAIESKKNKPVNKMYVERFKVLAKERVEDILKKFDVKYKVEYDVHTFVRDQFKDNAVKDGTADIMVTIGGTQIKIPVEVHNGQLCKPTKIYLDDDEYSFNKTNCRSLADGKQPRK